jgi:hypothetical protein
MAEVQTYKGSCHCGSVRFEVTTKLEGLMDCNCSHCWRKGVLLSFVPREQFKLVAGEDAQTEYRFNKKSIQHLFCKTCGVQSFAYGKMPDGKPIVAVNTRCFEGADLAAVPVKHHDGKSH